MNFRSKFLSLTTAILLAVGVMSISKPALASDENLTPIQNLQNKIDYGYQDILLAEILEFEKNNPDASSEEIDEHFMQLTEKYNRANKELNIQPKNDNLLMIASSSNYIYQVVGGQCKLYPEEQKLFNANPTKGFKACVAGKEAQDYTAYKFGYNGKDDKTDAFRHAFWNIMIIGFTNDYSFAQKWTNAHEDGNKGQSAMEYNMDMHNNAQGRLKAKSANISTSSSVTSTRAAIDQLYKSGKLQHIVNNKRVAFTGKNSDYKR